MNLEAIGRWVLPRLDAVLDEAVSVITDFQLYVQRWQALLDDQPLPRYVNDAELTGAFDLDAVLEAL